jgi:hypothetical protein
VPYGANGAISADGEWLAYTPYAEGLTEKRKHYFGGFAPDIWLFNLRDHQSRQITDWKGADTSPMWWRATVYYLSDSGAEARMNSGRTTPGRELAGRLLTSRISMSNGHRLVRAQMIRARLFSIMERICTSWILPAINRGKSR